VLFLFVIPYKTDAAVEHRPWGTIGLILANFAVAIFLGFPQPVYKLPDPVFAMLWEPPEEPFVNSLALEFGELHPHQWITNTFVHGDWFHLIVNMIFLWIFGLIVEGLVGWRRYLPVYLGIGVVASAIVQVIMLGAERNWAAGSSDAIFGLMTIALLWAPRNHTKVAFWIITIAGIGEITVLALCCFWIAVNVLYATIAGFELGTATIHLLGAALGLAAGYAMLRWNKVDCAGWDYLSLRAGRRARIVSGGTVSAIAPDPRAMSVDLVLKEGAPHDPGWQAWVPGLCGCATWAPTEAAVWQLAPAKIQEHLAWLRSHGDVPPPFEGSVRIAERVHGDEVLFTWDRVAATPEETRETRRLLQWSREDLLEAVESLPADALDWDPPYRTLPDWATWKTIRQILEHVARTEVGYYLPWIGYAPTLDLEGEELLPRSRGETLRFLEGLEQAPDRLRLAERGGEAWSVRKVLRRLVWHERVHTKSIRRLGRAFRAL
jgi:membrane associated rhomboid family serine protease